MLNVMPILRTAACLLALMVFAPARAAEYYLGVPPFLPKDQLEKSYQPLVEYLSKKTDESITLSSAPNFPSYWQRMNNGDHYDMLFGPAHLVDYQIKFLGYELLAKLRGNLSFTLISSGNHLIFEPSELTGKTVAVLPMPSMGAVQLDQLFPNPVRYPAIVEVSDANQAIERVLQGRAVGAYIPSPMVGGAGDVNTIYSTEPFPHFGFTVKQSLPGALKASLKQALLDSGDTNASQAMLNQANIPGFESASPATYRGYHRLLKSMWGYKGL